MTNRVSSSSRYRNWSNTASWYIRETNQFLLKELAPELYYKTIKTLIKTYLQHTKKNSLSVTSSELVMITWGVIFSTFNHTLHEISTKNNLGGGGGGTPLYGLYGDVPLDRVWFLTSLSQTGSIISRESILKRVYNFVCACPYYKQDEICLYPMQYKSNDLNLNLLHCNCQ